MSAQVEKNPLLLKIRKVLDTDLDSDENLLGGLNSLSDILPTNSLNHRRNLRSQIEKRQADLYESFLDEFTAIQQGVDSLDSHVRQMLQSCQEINEQLTSVKHRASDLIDEASSLQEHRTKCGLKIQILECLSESFQITAEDRETLCSASINTDFLSALQRARLIENNCKQLVQSESQNFGFSLLDATHGILETAYQRLYQFAQGECRSKTQETPDFSVLLRSAFLELINRPALFKYALDDYANARRTVTVKSFINALTLGSDPASYTSSKPIDLRSHDPVRYGSDILACVHQLSASEREYLKLLLKACDLEAVTVKEFFAVCLDSITDGLCSPLKLRLEQVLVSMQDPMLLFKLNNVLRFYEHTLSGLLGASCQLSTTLSEIRELSWRLLFNCLDQYMRQTLDQSDYSCPDLAPTHAIHDTLELLMEILRSHDISLLPPEVHKVAINEISKTILDPLIVHCQRCADRFQLMPLVETGPLAADDRSNDLAQFARKAKAMVYLTNCYYLIQTTLARLNFVVDQIEQIATNLNASMDNLVVIQVSSILKRTHLFTLVHVIEQGHDVTTDGPLANRTESDLSEEEVRRALALFDSYLSGPDHYALPELQFLAGQRLKKVIRRRSADELHSRYQLIYKAVTDPANGYSSLLNDSDTAIQKIRTPQQVAELILNV